jgi:hypothetical protein
VGKTFKPTEVAAQTLAHEKEEDLFGGEDISSPSPSPAKSSSRPQAASAFMDPKPKRTEKSISRRVRSMDGRKVNPTTIIDAATALKAELAGLAAEKKQKGKSGNAAFFAKGGDSKPKSCLGAEPRRRPHHQEGLHDYSG